jgi:hypothetical protein
MDNSTNFGTMIFRALEEIWDEQAEFKKAHALVDSREWWVIPNVSPYAESLMQRITTDVFNDQASPDAEASMLLPWMAGIVGIFYVRKTRLPRPALLKLMQMLMDDGKKIPESIVDQMEKTDILVPLHTQDEIQMVIARAHAVGSLDARGGHQGYDRVPRLSDTGASRRCLDDVARRRRTRGRSVQRVRDLQDSRLRNP